MSEFMYFKLRAFSFGRWRSRVIGADILVWTTTVWKTELRHSTVDIGRSFSCTVDRIFGSHPPYSFLWAEWNPKQLHFAPHRRQIFETDISRYVHGCRCQSMIFGIGNVKAYSQITVSSHVSSGLLEIAPALIWYTPSAQELQVSKHNGVDRGQPVKVGCIAPSWLW